MSRQYALSPATKQKIIDLHRRGFPEREIAFQVRCSRGGVRSTLYLHGKTSLFKEEKFKEVVALLNSGMNSKEIAAQMGNISYKSVQTIAYYNRQRELLEPAKDLVGQVTDERVAIGKRWGPGRYLVVSDFHILFHSMKAVDQIMALDGGKFDGCIVAGDFIDEYWAGKFRKEMAVSHGHEIKASVALIEILAQKFGRVLYIQGNHEDRRWKQMLEAVKPVADLAEEAAKEVFAVIERARNYYYNQIPGVTVHNNWFVSLCNNRVIISHPDRFQSVPGNTAKAVFEHFMNHRKVYRLGNDIDAMLMGHLHRLAGPNHRLGVFTWELPAMCGVLSYQTSPKASNSGTVDTGYSVVATRSDGSLIFNESRSYLIDGWGDKDKRGAK